MKQASRTWLLPTTNPAFQKLLKFTGQIKQKCPVVIKKNSLPDPSPPQRIHSGEVDNVSPFPPKVYDEINKINTMNWEPRFCEWQGGHWDRESAGFAGPLLSNVNSGLTCQWEGKCSEVSSPLSRLSSKRKQPPPPQRRAWHGQLHPSHNRGVKRTILTPPLKNSQALLPTILSIL